MRSLLLLLVEDAESSLLIRAALFQAEAFPVTKGIWLRGVVGIDQTTPSSCAATMGPEEEPVALHRIVAGHFGHLHFQGRRRDHVWQYWDRWNWGLTLEGG